MFELVTKSYGEKESVSTKVSDRELAETLANSYYDCIDIYAVHVMNSLTGEILFYRCKG